MKNFHMMTVAVAALLISTSAFAQITTNSPGADINSPNTNVANGGTAVAAGGTAVAGGGTGIAFGGAGGLGVGVGLGGDGGAGGAGGVATGGTATGGTSNVITAPVIAPNISPDIRTTTTVSPTIRTDVNTTDVNTNLVNTRVDPTLINGQQQGQGQLQGQQQDAHNQQGQTQSTSSQATGGSSNQTQTSASTSAANNQGNSQQVGGQTMVVIEAKQLRAPVNTAYAAPLSIGGGVCAYSAFSVGGSGVGFSGSASKASMDEGCNDRADADLLARLGFQREAAEILKTHPRVAAAFNTVSQADKSKVYGQAPMDPIGDKLAAQADQVIGGHIVTAQGDFVRKDGTPVKGTMLPIPN